MKAELFFFYEKTKRKPADACGRRRLEDPAGRSLRKLRISSTASLPVGSEVCFQPSTANFI
ncbi:hypothetical protein [Alkalicoccus saliphilus]|uniref:Uncharacterized protein n=1 Tax=Alkalicoccus saliphilus TaxID=200989 RepID=A0A2T4U3P8_9BACI|nr:hypothetical protein [Alkalicoccus saliphilus]PTL38033.1 hypothetical protein C6Y45_13535 [Alkalicoccus saliphilus]